jgi:hypothetical protein
MAVEIDEGHHGATRLDGLNMAVVVAWPGPIHEGKGQAVPIVDERATDEQRNALLRIVSGLDADAGTLFQIFASTFEKVHDPLFAKIEFTVDKDGRRARLHVPGIIESRGEPIVNPITGQEHRARINLPNGFEYRVAEVGRGWTKISGPVPLDIEDSHAHFADLHMTQNGVVG